MQSASLYMNRCRHTNVSDFEWMQKCHHQNPIAMMLRLLCCQRRIHSRNIHFVVKQRCETCRPGSRHMICERWHCSRSAPRCMTGLCGGKRRRKNRQRFSATGSCSRTVSSCGRAARSISASTTITTNAATSAAPSRSAHGLPGKSGAGSAGGESFIGRRS